MNKRIKIICLSILSLSLLSGMQVEAWPSFKKSAGCAVLAAGVAGVLLKNRGRIRDSIQGWKNAVLAAEVTYALRQKRDSIRDSIQERKNETQKWVEDRLGECKDRFKNRFEECKEKMRETRVVQTLAEKTDDLQSWTGDLQSWAKEKLNNFQFSNPFSRFRGNTDDNEEEAAGREIESSEDGIDLGGTPPIKN